jgi:hypothetical protein
MRAEEGGEDEHMLPDLEVVLQADAEAEEEAQVQVEPGTEVAKTSRKAKSKSRKGRASSAAAVEVEAAQEEAQEEAQGEVAEEAAGPESEAYAKAKGRKKDKKERKKARKELEARAAEAVNAVEIETASQPSTLAPETQSQSAEEGMQGAQHPRLALAESGDDGDDEQQQVTVPPPLSQKEARALRAAMDRLVERLVEASVDWQCEQLEGLYARICRELAPRAHETDRRGVLVSLEADIPKWISCARQ